MEAFGEGALVRIDDSVPASKRHAAVKKFNAPPRHVAPEMSYLKPLITVWKAVSFCLKQDHELSSLASRPMMLLQSISHNEKSGGLSLRLGENNQMGASPHVRPLKQECRANHQVV